MTIHIYPISLHPHDSLSKIKVSIATPQIETSKTRSKGKLYFSKKKLAFWAISRAKSAKNWISKEINLIPNPRPQNFAQHRKITFYIACNALFDHNSITHSIVVSTCISTSFILASCHAWTSKRHRPIFLRIQHRKEQPIEYSPNHHQSMYYNPHTPAAKFHAL